MHFVSFSWLAWMALTVAVFWLTPARFRHQVLVAICFIFIATYSWQSALILSCFTLFTFFTTNQKQITGLRATIISFVIIAVLAAYKIIVSAPSEDLLTEILIPLGLSYYTLRLIHYVIERYKGQLPHHEFKDFLIYMLFLPTIVVGPIHRFPQFFRDYKRHHWNGPLLAEGLERILYGYVKITFLANYLVSIQFTRIISSLDQANESLILYLEIIRGGLNLYLQFSGFSDIAIGFARLLGYRVMENFNWPYFQKNISDFWRSWHISLTSWCREYVYTTVFSISRSPALGATATLLAIAFWHEVSLRYLIWGLYHSCGIIAWQHFQKIKKYLPKTQDKSIALFINGLSILLTIHFVWFGFVIVRQPDLNTVLHIFKTVLFFWI